MIYKSLSMFNLPTSGIEWEASVHSLKSADVVNCMQSSTSLAQKVLLGRFLPGTSVRVGIGFVRISHS